MTIEQKVSVHDVISELFRICDRQSRPAPYAGQSICSDRSSDPENVAQLKVYLGLISYSRFLPNNNYVHSSSTTVSSFEAWSEVEVDNS